MSWLTLLAPTFLSGCLNTDPAPASSTQPAVDLRSGSVAAWQALQHIDGATYDLPPDNLPPGGTGEARFPLPEWDPDPPMRGYTAWSAPMPFTVSAPRPQYAPYGAELWIGGERVPFLTEFEDAETGGWRVDRGRVRLLRADDPSGTDAVLIAPELDTGERRLHLRLSDLKPSAFVRTEITLGPHTRPGLLIPAPGRAEWSVSIPAGARLDLGAALLVPPVPGAASDGATARVRIDGEEVWSAKIAPDQESFTDLRLDLSRWAGKTVTLALESDPGPSPVRDHLVFTAPIVSAPPAPSPAPRHIVLVGIDTLRYDALSVNGNPEQTSPELDAWAANAVVFDQARAPAPRTRPSFRSALTGVEPLQAIRATQIAATLQAEGFRTAGFTANVHLVPRFGFNEGFTEWYYENGARADVQIARALEWMKAHQDEDFFVFLHLMDPHTLYAAPFPWTDRFVHVSRPKAVPELFGRWEILNLMKSGRLDADAKAWIQGRYLSEVAYATRQLAGFFAEIERWPARTLTAVFSDHGEEFWDHGGFEHNHSLYDELIRVVLMIRPPGGWGGGPHRRSEPVSLLDLVPTLLDLLDIPQDRHGPTGGTSLRPFLDAAQADRAAALSTALWDRPMAAGHLMFERERWAVTSQGWKYILHTVSGQEELYHLTSPAGPVDPRELQGLHDDAAQLAVMRDALARATGWPVRAVWRLRPQNRLRGTLELTFGAPIIAAGVIDPEADEPIRANLEWGEKARTRPDDVARLALSEDRLRLQIEGRARISGQTLWIACAPTPDGLPGCPLLSATLDGKDYPQADPRHLRVDSFVAGLDPGWLLDQQFTEEQALHAPVSDQTMQQLIELGYIHPGD